MLVDVIAASLEVLKQRSYQHLWKAATPPTVLEKNGGGGENRTRVQSCRETSHYRFSSKFLQNRWSGPNGHPGLRLCLRRRYQSLTFLRSSHHVCSGSGG